MRRPAAATRPARRQASAPVALFPFLAVLMCALGALALLLVVVNRQSRLQAVAAARAKASAAAAAVSEDDVKAERDLVQWRIEQLQASRQKTEAQLSEARVKLGHLEDHERRLREQIAGLQSALAGMDGQPAGDAGRKRAEAELSRLRAEMAEAQQRLAAARQAAQARQPLYAVVPYEGPNPTRRRPIYIECRADAVVLQPEQVLLTAEDFDGPLGPGNPLDAALRAVREDLLRRGAAGEEVGEPYPLLLVRPDGIEAYYAARAALKSWGSDFGYELIGQDWKLQFPKPEPRLAEAVEQVVETARARQQQLIAAAPRHFGSGGSRSARYRAAPFRGGIIRDGGPTEDARPALASRPPAPHVAGPREPGGAGPEPGSGRPASPGPGAPGGQPGQPPAERPEGFVAGRPPRDTPWPEEHERPDASRTAQRPGEWIERPPTDRSRPNTPPQPVRSLAEKRGRDWALPGAARGSVGVGRPLRIDCHQDRLVVAPESGAAGKTVPLEARTEDAIDAFLSEVWEHMDSWGIAGKGMYWRPILNVHVAPNGELRYEELNALLQGSGFEVRRKDERGTMNEKR